MDSIRHTSTLVKEALENNEQARDSDNYLYYLLCEAKLAGMGIDIGSISFRDGLLNRKRLNLPQFETVRRARQKVQAKFPELASSTEVTEVKCLREEDFRAFARSDL